MELQWIVWQWDHLMDQIGEHHPELGRTIRRSTRPIAVDRRADGRIVLALGCWWPPDLDALRAEDTLTLAGEVIGQALEEHTELVVAPWPGGMARQEPTLSPDERPPDVLAGLPDAARQTASLCESALQRLFFAHAWRRGWRLAVQQRILTFRIDFAAPERRIGAEVAGWDWHEPGRRGDGPRERLQELGMEGWRVIWFAGAEVLADVEGCLDRFARLAPGGLGPRRPAPPGHGARRAPTRPRRER